MIKKFNQFLENKNSGYLLYYAFDWDDNILNMPTVIHMDKKDGDSWVPHDVSTSDFADVRNDENYRMLNNNPDEAFSEFRDFGPRGIEAFLTDTKAAIASGSYGPAWDDFIECLTNGSIFAIITARGHEPEAIRLGIDWILDNVLTENEVYDMYNNLLKFEYMFDRVEGEKILKGDPSKNELVKKYLDHCDLVGVSAPSRGGSPENPEKEKENALMDYKTKVNDFAQNLGMEAKVGFSDDDLGNVKHIEDLVDNLHHEKFPNIVEFVVKNTKNPEDVTKKVRTMNLTEGNDTPGMEASVLPFTQFNNMTNKLYPKDEKTRQDDFANQFRRQSEYLAKTSKDILGKKKEKPSKPSRKK
jgi:hypothetical protein